MNNIKAWTSLPMLELPTGASCSKDWKRIFAELSFMPPSLPHRRPNRSRHRTVLVFSLHGHVTQSLSTNGNEKHVASERVWASYSPTVNGQGLYISPLRKYGRVTHSQRTGFIQHFASYKAWASYSSTVNEYEQFIFRPCLFVCLQSLKCVVMLKLFLRKYLRNT